MNNPADNIYPINELIQNRWSPRAFSSKPVEIEKLQSLFEAARWSASGSNDQPWQFIIGFKGDETWSRIFNTLVEFNQLWAGEAPVLMLVSAVSVSAKSGSPNPSYAYDTGQAVATMSLQATAMDLFVHQMGGFDKTLARNLFAIPETVMPLVIVAAGYYGDAEKLHPNLKPLEKSPRERRNLSTFVFSTKHGNPAELLKKPG